MTIKLAYNIEKPQLAEKSEMRFTTYYHSTKIEISPYQKNSQLKQLRKDEILA